MVVRTVTTSATADNTRPVRRLRARATREHGLLRVAGMSRRSDAGFSLLEILVVVALIAVLAGVSVGVTQSAIRAAKAQSGAQEVAAFLHRARETAISRRRNIEVRFLPPNTIQSAERAVPPNPAPPTVLETIRFEGRMEYRTFAGLGNTPDMFDITGGPINLGGANPVMFTSEGTFTDVNGDPINATIFLGVDQQPDTASAVTILGTTATLRMWRHNGSEWVQ